jgi:hypothetical protein
MTEELFRKCIRQKWKFPDLIYNKNKRHLMPSLSTRFEQQPGNNVQSQQFQNEVN